LNYTIVFPTLDGTKIDQFFKANSSRIGTIEENSVVSIDSQPNQANLSIYSIATQEYHVTDLPSYVAIDKTGVVSLAGVGTIIDSEQKLTDWLNSAFYTKNKLYNEIEKGVDKDKKGAGKWYARTVSTGVATTDDLADSIQENTSFSRGDVRGLVIALIDEISYRLRQGETVALEGLGRFHLTVESDPVDNPDDFDIKKHIKNVKCRFVPTSTRNARTGKKNQTLAYGARVEWAEPEYDDEDDD